MKRLSMLDAYQAIDEIVMSYQADGMSAETAMSYITSIIADEESGTEV